MTQEEFKMLQERHNKAWQLNKEMGDLRELITNAEENGVMICIKGAEWANLRLHIMKQLYDNIGEMVTAALKAKYVELQKKFNDL